MIKRVIKRRQKSADTRAVRERKFRASLVQLGAMIGREELLNILWQYQSMLDNDQSQFAQALDWAHETRSTR